MFFAVPVDGFGQMFVETDNSETALNSVRQFLARNRINVDGNDGVGEAISVDDDRVVDELVLDAEGFPLLSDSPAVDERTSSPDEPESLTPASPDVGDAAQSPGEPGTLQRFFRFDVPVIGDLFVLATELEDAERAGRAHLAQFGRNAGIPADFSFGEPEVLDMEDLPVSADPNFVIDAAGLIRDDLLAGTPRVEDASLPVDVQSFPFASFQNAEEALGLDPEGALGSTISQRFDALAPAARIGSLTGTINPIGQDPGALEAFFLENFGDLGLAAQTFSDLLDGQTAGDLGSEELLSFQALLNPDIATSGGRGSAADVFRLARAAAQDRFGSFVASRLLPSNARLFRELERQLAGGDGSLNFLRFAREQNLLPA